MSFSLLQPLKTRLGVPEDHPEYDGDLQDKLDEATRTLIDYMNRDFTTGAAVTKVYDAPFGSWLQIDDFLTITAVVAFGATIALNMGYIPSRFLANDATTPFTKLRRVVPGLDTYPVPTSWTPVGASSGIQQVSVTGVPGWSAVPLLVVQANELVALAAWRTSQMMDDEGGGGPVGMMGAPGRPVISGHVHTMINQYRRDAPAIVVAG